MIALRTVTEKYPRSLTCVILASVWNGETDIATWTATGGNRPAGADARDYSAMFDDDPQTYWHGSMPSNNKTYVRNTVTVKFTYPVIFHALEVTARPRYLPNQDRYRKLCIFVDDVEQSCTTENRTTSPGETITLVPIAVRHATKIELRYQEEVAAEAAELRILYFGKMRIRYFL